MGKGKGRQGSGRQRGHKGKQAGRRSSVPARVETARIAARSEVIVASVPWAGRVAMIAASYYPLQAVQPMVEDLAGQTTHVTTSISLSIAISVCLAGTYFVQRRKLRQQRDELERLRGRLEEIDSSRIPELAEGKYR